MKDVILLWRVILKSPMPNKTTDFIWGTTLLCFLCLFVAKFRYLLFIRAISYLVFSIRSCASG